MDKLEKALAKARKDRRNSLAAKTAVPPPPDETPAAAPAPVSGETDALAAESVRVRLSPAELERHRIVARPGVGANVDTFRMLRTRVLQMMASRNLKTIAITSPRYGDGKTTIAINLALSLALDVKQTVLLVDLDLRKPNVHDFLGLRPEVGLTDYLLKDAPLPGCMVKPDRERLVILPVAHPLEDSSEILGTPKMAALAQELKSRYADRVIVYDMPPLLTQDDTIAFLPLVDGVLLVVRDGVSEADDITQCMALLEGKNFLGTILNDCR